MPTTVSDNLIDFQKTIDMTAQALNESTVIGFHIHSDNSSHLAWNNSRVADICTRVRSGKGEYGSNLVVRAYAIKNTGDHDTNGRALSALCSSESEPILEYRPMSTERMKYILSAVVASSVYRKAAARFLDTDVDNVLISLSLPERGTEMDPQSWQIDAADECAEIRRRMIELPTLEEYKRKSSRHAHAESDWIDDVLDRTGDKWFTDMQSLTVVPKSLYSTTTIGRLTEFHL